MVPLLALIGTAGLVVGTLAASTQRPAALWGFGVFVVCFLIIVSIGLAQ